MKQIVFYTSIVVILLVFAANGFTQIEGMLDQQQLTNLADRIAQAGKKRIAVVDFTDLQGNVTELGRFLAEEVSVALVGAGKGFQIIDRVHLRSILAEHKLALTGVIDPKTARQLGRIAGVGAIVTGSITPFGDNIRVSFKVLDTETAMIIAASSGNLARTAAINELLARGIESSHSVAQQPATVESVPSSGSSKSTKVGDISVTLERILVSKENQVRAVLVFFNESDKMLTIQEDHANYPAVTDEIGSVFKYERGLRDELFLNPKSSSKAVLYFQPTTKEIGSVFSLKVPFVLFYSDHSFARRGFSFTNIRAQKLN